MGKYLDMIRQHEQYERTYPIETAKTDEVVSKITSSLPPLQPTWRELAEITAGLEQDDPRLGPVLSALAACDYDKAGDRSGFEHTVERIRRLMQFVPGATVRWEGTVNHRLTVLGPATVEHVHCDQGQLWVFTTWKGQGRWIPESVIAQITMSPDHGRNKSDSA